MQEMVITAVGSDRPGLVDELTGVLLDAGANVADTRMVNLRGQFAMILLIEAEDSKMSAITLSLEQASQKIGLSIDVQQPHASTPATTQGLAYHLRTYSMDKPGIVHHITHLLHEQNVNIEELETRLEPGVYGGSPRFMLEVHMTIPGDVPIKSLKASLAELCESLNCDFDLEPM